MAQEIFKSSSGGDARPSLAARISSRAKEAAVPVGSELAASLASYIGLLAKWNVKINLTSLQLEPPDERSLDRLIVEPLVAARLVLPSAQFAIDIGSGGGSPALPMKLALPAVRFALVESKVRKAAFLGEAVRLLELEGVEVENCRFEQLASRAGYRETADVVTIRAVKTDRGLWEGIRQVLRPQGQVILFIGGDPLAAGAIPPSFKLEATAPVPSSASQVAVVIRVS